MRRLANRRAIHRHEAFFDAPTHFRAGYVRQEAGKVPVDPAAFRVAGRHLKRHDLFDPFFGHERRTRLRIC